MRPFRTAQFLPADSERCWPAGPEDTTILHRSGKGDKGLDCWMVVPAEPSPLMPPLVIVHGIHRGAEAIARVLADRAGATGRVIIAPRFDAETWPLYQQVVRKGRADLALLSLLSDLRLTGMWRGDRIELAGYSGGAQFAHRFAMLHPQIVARLSLVASGWYTFPDAARFPYGTADSDRAPGWGPRMALGLDAYLRLPIEVLVGRLDTDRDPSVRSNPTVDAQQGTTRVERAERYVRALEQASEARGVRVRARLSVLDGCAHDFRTCVSCGGLDRILMPDDPLSHPLSRCADTPAIATQPLKQGLDQQEGAR